MSEGGLRHPLAGPIVQATATIILALVIALFITVPFNDFQKNFLQFQQETLECQRVDTELTRLDGLIRSVNRSDITVLNNLKQAEDEYMMATIAFMNRDYTQARRHINNAMSILAARDEGAYSLDTKRMLEAAERLLEDMEKDPKRFGLTEETVRQWRARMDVAKSLYREASEKPKEEFLSALLLLKRAREWIPPKLVS